jgi:hypothetical protein
MADDTTKVEDAVQKAQEDAPPPIQVNSSPAKEQASQTLATVLIILGGLGSVLGFVSKHDIAGLVVWLQSAPGVPFLAALVLVGTYAWRQLKVRKNQAEKVVLAHVAPDEIGQVKGDTK